MARPAAATPGAVSARAVEEARSLPVLGWAYLVGVVTCVAAVLAREVADPLSRTAFHSPAKLAVIAALVVVSYGRFTVLATLTGAGLERRRADPTIGNYASGASFAALLLYGPLAAALCWFAAAAAVPNLWRAGRLQLWVARRGVCALLWAGNSTVAAVWLLAALHHAGARSWTLTAINQPLWHLLPLLTVVGYWTLDVALAVGSNVLRLGFHGFLKTGFNHQRAQWGCLAALGAVVAELATVHPALALLGVPVGGWLAYTFRIVEIERAARVDPKTGLLNMAHFNAVAARALHRRADRGEPACLLVVDMDHLREVNNRHGHLVGDEAIATVTDALRAVVPADGLVARFGGEEFVALLTGTDPQAGLRVAEQLRATVATTVFGPDLTVTVSIGVAAAPGDGTGLTALLAAADAAVYRAKAAGRNRVVGTSGCHDAGPR